MITWQTRDDKFSVQNKSNQCLCYKRGSKFEHRRSNHFKTLSHIPIDLDLYDPNPCKEVSKYAHFTVFKCLNKAFGVPVAPPPGPLPGALYIKRVPVPHANLRSRILLLSFNFILNWPSIASQEGRYVLPQRVALESNALLSQPIGVKLLSTRCFRKQHVAYMRSDTTRCFHF